MITVNKLADTQHRIFNVKNFGAQGNGTTDDTRAIQRAIQALAEHPGTWNSGAGGMLYFPAGRYLHSEPFIIQNNVKILGDGADQGTIIMLADGSNCNQFEFGLRNSVIPTTVDMRGVYLSMDRTTMTEEVGNIVCYNRLRHSHFQDLFLIGATKHNFHMLTDPSIGANAQNTYIYDCSFESAENTAVKLEVGYNMNIINSYFGFLRNTGYGLDVAGDGLQISGCWKLEGSPSGGIYIRSGNNIRILNNFLGGANTIAFEANAAEIELEQRAGTVINNVLISNNIWKAVNTHQTTYGIKLNNATNVYGVGNLIRNHTGDAIQSTTAFASQNVENLYIA